VCARLGCTLPLSAMCSLGKVSHFISGRSNRLRCAKSNGLLKIRTHLTKCREVSAMNCSVPNDVP
jgi:hypothetical protein